MFSELRGSNGVGRALVRYSLTLCMVAIVNDLAEMRGALLPPNSAVLPDIGHSLLPFIPEMAKLSDSCLLLLCLVLIVLIAARQHSRCNLICEFVDLHTFLMLVRCFTIPLTTLPGAQAACNAEHTLSPESLTTRVLQPDFLTAWCHDLIYSGHTVFYTLAALFIFDLQRPHHALSAAMLLVALGGSLCLLVSRVHYTVDVALAAIITTLAYAVRRPVILQCIGGATEKTADPRGTNVEHLV